LGCLPKSRLPGDQKRRFRVLYGRRPPCYILVPLFAVLLIDHYLPWPVGAAAPLAPAPGEVF